MTSRSPRWIAVSLATLGFVFATGPIALAQAADPQPEVLARGPVHEAFAATNEHPAAAPVVPKAPPEAVEELPPDQKPAGENVAWIPGYWHWDEERTDYIWVSGFWRVTPPGRAWVPGSWREVRGGWQWAHGFWQDMQAGRAELEYLPPPPAPIEIAPSIPAPSESHVYVPGSWVWRANRYAWRPGLWIDHRPGWIWTPAHYRWTPVGHVFVDGYWDYPLAERGILFAPVYLPPSLYARGPYQYSPYVVVREPVLYTSLFVRRGWGSYYFGDYYDARYASSGYSAWCGTHHRGGFSIAIGFGRGWNYDPLWSYYRAHHYRDQVWMNNVSNVYAGRYNGSIPKPPRTFAQQNVVVNNITNNTVINNVTNNTTTGATLNNVTMLTPLKNATALDQKLVLKPVAQADRIQEQKEARELRAVGVERKKLEGQLTEQAIAPTSPGQTAPALKPRAVTLAVPKASVARAQVPTDKAGKTPPPAVMKLRERPGSGSINDAKPVPITPGQPPRVAPKADPKPQPPIVGPKPLPPKGEVKPMTPVVPKTDPKPVPPKGEPKPVAPVVPKATPKPMTPPPMPPKGEPKPVTPVVPKATPKPMTPPPMAPKVEPKPMPMPPKKTDPPPMPPKKVDPPPMPPKKVDPPPVPPKKVDPPKTASARPAPTYNPPPARTELRAQPLRNEVRSSYTPPAAKPSYSPPAAKASYTPPAAKPSYSPPAVRSSYSPPAAKPSNSPAPAKSSPAPAKPAKSTSTETKEKKK